MLILFLKLNNPYFYQKFSISPDPPAPQEVKLLWLVGKKSSCGKIPSMVKFEELNKLKLHFSFLIQSKSENLVPKYITSTI
jgi:hypothetical protein